MEKIAIVILNWNGAKMLSQYLPSVITYSKGASIYVADNASTDNSIELLNNDFPDVNLIMLDKNYGFAEGYNRALAQIDAEYYLLLNSDVEVTEGWLEALVEFMDKNKDVAACQPKLLAIHDRNKFEYAGAAGGYIDKYGYPFCKGRIFNTIETDKSQYDDVCDIFWATGACMLTRARLYNKVKGLDGRFFAHCEEIDYCWRLKLNGYRICLVPYSKVYHVGGGTLPKSNPHKTYLNFRNNLTMLYKNLPQKELNQVMRVRYFLDYIAAFEMLFLQRNLGDFKAVIKARMAFKKWKHNFDDDRKQYKDQEMIIAERRNFSILWQYYIKNRKKYNQLPRT